MATTAVPMGRPPAAPRPRQTRQRRLIQEHLAALEGFRTAQQIHADLRNAGHSIGLATV